MSKIKIDKGTIYKSVLPIEEVITDYFLLGETPLAIAYRRRKGQEVCGIVINSKFLSYDK